MKGTFEALDDWRRCKMRCIPWCRWKKPRTRAANLMRPGLKEDRASASASNGRGPWWNAGASHMNDAFRKAYVDRCGLPSFIDLHRRLNRAA